MLFPFLIRILNNTGLYIIIRLMGDTPKASASEIGKMRGVSAKGVQYHIKRLKANGEIDRRGFDYGGTWKIKF